MWTKGEIMDNRDINVDWKQFIQKSIDAMLVTDDKGNIILANQSAADNLDMPVGELVGNNVYDMLKKEIYINSTIVKALEEKQVVTDIVIHKENKLLSTSVPILDTRGNVKFVITNSRTHELVESLYGKITAVERNNQRYKEIITLLNESSNETIIADSPEMKRIIRYCDSIAPYDGNVLISGESGCGKDLIARYIHSKSSRSKNSFIPINCAAIPKELFESECFGYSKGAFTGALSSGKIGYFELANGGTLFLDEIGELSLDMQSKLLRVTETGEFTPVGSNKVIKTDVRIISATNRNLSRMTEDGGFREDLYYRLSVIPIEVPPLRERISDIETISLYFIEKLNQKYGTKKYLSAWSINNLRQYKWPGNVRELKNVIERWFIITEGEKIDISLNRYELPGAETADREENTGRLRNPPDFTGTLNEATKEFQKRYIEYVIEKNGNHIGKAAEELGVHRSTLYRKNLK